MVTEVSTRSLRSRLNQPTAQPSEPFVALLDDAISGRALAFEGYVASEYLSAAQLDTLDDILRAGWALGRHALLAIDYEFGLGVVGLPGDGVLALHWFERRRQVDADEWLSGLTTDTSAGVSEAVWDDDQESHAAAVAEIQEAIARGDTYQINYTTRLRLTAFGHPAALYRRLRQPVAYAALAHLPGVHGESRWTLSFSPELFLDIRDGVVRAEPMKGTAPVLGDGRDDERAAALSADQKNLAENVMIVDLLRNDLGQLAVGPVRVPRPFSVTRFGAVWQMTSLIEAQLRPGVTVAEVLRAAFPCGSITGAPKRSSMAIIDRVERTPRGLYTGSLGYLEPDGDSFAGTLNVIIRTLQLTPRPDGAYDGSYGVGSGIVADSTAAHEYTECGWKAQFLTGLRPDFGVFETMLVEDGRCELLPQHLARLTSSAATLNLPLKPSSTSRIAHYIASLPPGQHRLKATLTVEALQLTHQRLTPLPAGQRVILADTTLPVRGWLRRFKTTSREIFDALWLQAQACGAFDALVFNTDGHLLEGGRSSVFVRIDNQWHTPSLDLDILDGVLRSAVLANPRRFLGVDQVHESRLTRADVLRADEIRLGNALRGLFPVKLT